MVLNNPRISPGHVKAGTFVNDVADGSQVITGVGFAPAFLIIGSAGNLPVIVIYDGTIQVGQKAAATVIIDVLDPQTDGSNRIRGNMASLDADGFTITWSSLVGTAPARTFFYLAVAK